MQDHLQATGSPTAGKVTPAPEFAARDQFVRRVCLGLRTKDVPVADYEGAVVWVARQKFDKGWTAKKTIEYLKRLRG